MASTYGVVFFLIVLVIGFTLAKPGRFLTVGNVSNMISDVSIPGMLALAVVLPLAAGEFDLSIAATLGFGSILSAYLLILGLSLPLAILVCLVVGAAIGAMNAWLVVKVGINSFIATLGIATLLAGGNLLVSGGGTLFSGIPDSIRDFSMTNVAGLPLIVYYFFLLVLGLWYLLEHTPYGRLLRATGLGRDAARLTGVPTDRFLASAFILGAVIAALCGVLNTGKIGSATAAVGPEFLLPAYAAAFLGSTTISPGRFNVWGTVIGALVLSIGTTGLAMMGAPFWVPNIFNGFALIAAVGIATTVARRAKEKV
jgi:ribose transport system permease protein